MFLIHLHTTHQNVVLKELNSNPTGAEWVSDLAGGSCFPDRGWLDPSTAAAVKQEPSHLSEPDLNRTFLGGTDRAM